ncbi:hypothetical protein U1Q18_014216 [Sarracenia purpurea var. burkii]
MGSSCFGCFQNREKRSRIRDIHFLEFLDSPLFRLKNQENGLLSSFRFLQTSEKEKGKDLGCPPWTPTKPSSDFFSLVKSTVPSSLIRNSLKPVVHSVQPTIAPSIHYQYWGAP